MTTTLMWIVIILMAIGILVNAIRNEELKNRVTHLEKDNRFIGERLNSLLDVFEHSTKIVEATERMSNMYCDNSKWVMETTDSAISAIVKELDDIQSLLSNNDKIYQSLSKRNELLDEELKKTCKCCEDMQQRMALILTPPQIKPIPVPDLTNDPNKISNPSEWDKIWYEFFHQNDSTSDSAIPNSQTDPVGFLGKAIHVAQSAAAAVNGMKDLAESAVEAVKESVDSVPDPDEIEPAEWLEDGREEGAEEGAEEGTDD